MASPQITPDFFPDAASDFIPDRPDFAANPPKAAGSHVDMQPAKTGAFDRLESGPSDVPAMPNKVPQSIMHAPDSLGTAIGGMTIGGGAAMAAAPVAAPIARGAEKFVANNPWKTMAAIKAAEYIPYVGKYARQIPGWLPLLARGGKGAALPEAEAAEAETAAPNPRPNIPVPDSYHAGPGPVIERGPAVGSPGDIRETRGIQEQMRNAAEVEQQTFASQQKRDWFARNQPGSSKRDLTGAVEPPVKYTKTPGVKSGTVVPAPDENLEPILRKSLAQARKKKGTDRE